MEFNSCRSYCGATSLLDTHTARYAFLLFFFSVLCLFSKRPFARPLTAKAPAPMQIPVSFCGEVSSANPSRVSTIAGPLIGISSPPLSSSCSVSSRARVKDPSHPGGKLPGTALMKISGPITCWGLQKSRLADGDGPTSRSAKMGASKKEPPNLHQGFLSSMLTAPVMGSYSAWLARRPLL